MKKLFSTVAVAIVMVTSLRAASDGRWYKPFHTGVNSKDLRRAMATGDYIWFMTDKGIGRWNTVTMETIFFGFDFIKPRHDIYDYRFIVGDSNHVALYLDPEDGNDLVVYNGSSWKRIVCPFLDDEVEVAIDNRGNIWIYWDFLIAKSDGREWDTIMVRKGESVFPQFGVIDDSCNLWFHCFDTSTDSVSLYRFDGSQTHKIASVNERYIEDYYKDVKGAIWFFGDSALYKVGPDQTLTTYRTGYRVSGIVDSDGNLWYCQYGQNGLYKTDLSTSTTDCLDTLRRTYSLLSCNNGVYILNKDDDGFNYYKKNNILDHTSIPMESLWSDACGGFCRDLFQGGILFKKDSTIVDVCNQHVVEYNCRGCRQLPSLPYIFCLLERRDGTVLASGSDSNGTGGIYLLQNTAWMRLPGAENITIHNIIEDKNGKIWGTDNNQIVRQTDSGWERIDSSNSNLPFNRSYNFPVCADSAGAIWWYVNSTIAKTYDGYHWTLIDSSNSKLPTNHSANYYVDIAGHFTVLCYAGYRGDACPMTIRAAYDDTAWVLDTIYTPVTGGFYEDRRGDLWMDIQNEDVDDDDLYGHRIYRHTGSSWICYDYATTSYALEDIIGEDAAGKLYFWDAYGETVVFDRDGLNTTMAYRPPLLASSLIVHQSAAGMLSIDFALSKASTISLSLFSLNGRIVQKLLSGRCNPGRHRRSYTIVSAPGIYFLRLNAPDGSQVKRIVLR